MKRILLSAAVAVAVVASIGASLDQPPSIVMFVADDLGFNDLGLTNPERHTPTIDAMARKGVRLDHYYSYKYCSPARASLLTGRYPGHGIWETNPAVDAPMGINASFVMLPAALKRAGYKTHQIGKWHLGFYQPRYLPHARGFDTSFGYIANGNQRAFDQVDPALPGPDEMGPCAGTDLWNTTHEAWGQNGTYDAWMYTAAGQDIIDAHDFSSAPLFLMMMFHNVHEPMEVPEMYYNQSYFPQDMPRTRLLYNGMCSALDESVANITSTLTTAGVMNNTIIVFISDNGGNIGTGAAWGYSEGGGNNFPLRGGKFGFFEGGIRVPAFVYAPGLLPASASGQMLSSKVHVSDWYPTLVNAAGVKMHTNETQGLDGIDIWPALLDPTHIDTNRTEIVVGIDGATTPPSGAYIYGDLKLVVGGPNGQKPNCWYGTTSPNGTLYCDVGAEDACSPDPCLFNLTADPTEHEDISNASPSLLQEMQTRYASAIARLQPSISQHVTDGSDTHACMHNTCAVERGYLEWDGAYHSLSGYHRESLSFSAKRVNDTSLACEVMVNNSRWWKPWANDP